MSDRRIGSPHRMEFRRQQRVCDVDLVSLDQVPTHVLSQDLTLLYEVLALMLPELEMRGLAVRSALDRTHDNGDDP